ncbi:MAG: hypothetical protein ACRYG4_13055 [Janthinobacterium lividum]
MDEHAEGILALDQEVAAQRFVAAGLGVPDVVDRCMQLRSFEAPQPVLDVLCVALDRDELGVDLIDPLGQIGKSGNRRDDAKARHGDARQRYVEDSRNRRPEMIDISA